MCAMKSNFIALCCDEPIWGWGGASRRLGARQPGLRESLCFHGIPAGHTLSRAPSPCGPRRGHRAVGERKTVILEAVAEPEARPLPEAQCSDKAAKEGG